MVNVMNEERAINLAGMERERDLIVFCVIGKAIRSWM